MQVYDLMNLLAEMPAGANIEVCGILETRRPRKNCEEIEDGIYNFCGKIDNVERSGEYTVLINIE